MKSSCSANWMASFHLSWRQVFRSRQKKILSCIYLEGNNPKVKRWYNLKRNYVTVIYSCFPLLTQVKMAWMLKKMRKSWLFCMIHVWTVTLTQTLGSTTNWHSQIMRAHCFVFRIDFSFNCFWSVTGLYNLSWNSNLEVTSSFANKWIYFVNSVLFS